MEGRGKLIQSEEKIENKIHGESKDREQACGSKKPIRQRGELGHGPGRGGVALLAAKVGRRSDGEPCKVWAVKGPLSSLGDGIRKKMPGKGGGRRNGNCRTVGQNGGIQEARRKKKIKKTSFGGEGRARAFGEEPRA